MNFLARFVTVELLSLGKLHQSFIVESPCWPVCLINLFGFAHLALLWCQRAAWGLVQILKPKPPLPSLLSIINFWPAVDEYYLLKSQTPPLFEYPVFRQAHLAKSKNFFN